MHKLISDVYRFPKESHICGQIKSKFEQYPTEREKVKMSYKLNTLRN